MSQLAFAREHMSAGSAHFERRQWELAVDRWVGEGGRDARESDSDRVSRARDRAPGAMRAAREARRASRDLKAIQCTPTKQGG
jgi:hypothetical protein